MLFDRIDGLIATELKAGNKGKCESLKLIKAALLNEQKSGKEYTEEVELKTLLKMKAQIEDSIKQYTEGNRLDLVEKEKADLSVVTEFLPKEPTDDDIRTETEKAISSLGREPVMSDMKTIMSEVKKVYPTANGGVVSAIVRQHMK